MLIPGKKKYLIKEQTGLKATQINKKDKQQMFMLQPYILEVFFYDI